MDNELESIIDELLFTSDELLEALLKYPMKNSPTYTNLVKHLELFIKYELTGDWRDSDD